MNSVERVHAALKGEPYDRVPILEFVIDEKVAQLAVPGCIDTADCMDSLDMDGVGCGADFDIIETRQDGTIVDEWGVAYRQGSEAVLHPVGERIKTISEANSYAPPDPDKPGRLSTLIDIVSRYKGRRAIVFHHRAAFMWSAYLFGLDKILQNFLLEPELVEIVMDKVLQSNMDIVRNAIRAGAEVIVLGDDYAHNTAPLMSPALFGQFILPRLTRMIEMIHAENALCIKHSDGNLYPILDMIISAGPDGLNPIEPVAGMSLKKTRKLVGSRLCLVGNIDCAHLLSSGTTGEVSDAVRNAIIDGADGGFIISSSNSIHSSCRPENLVAMVKAAKEFGLLKK